MSWDVLWRKTHISAQTVIYKAIAEDNWLKVDFLNCITMLQIFKSHWQNWVSILEIAHAILLDKNG